MKKLNKIILYRKVDTPLKFDFSSFNFPTNSKVIWTVKITEDGETLISREFDESRIYNELVTPAEVQSFTNRYYYYDFVLLLDDGTILKQCLISDIEMDGTLYGTRNNN